MKKETKILWGGALAASIVAGLAMATPTIGAFYNVILSTGTAERDINTHAHLVLPGMDEDFSAVSGDGGRLEHHSAGSQIFTRRHDRMAHAPRHRAVTLAADSGSVDWYDSKCGKTVYNAGDSWTEGTKLHDVVNHGSADVHFLVTYIVAKDVQQAYG